MTDCGLRDADVNTVNLNLAFEYAYTPLPRFWRAFNMAALVGNISERFPNSRSAVQKPNWTADGVLREVEEILYWHVFDEASAEMMMALPGQARPTDNEAAFNWTLSELRKKAPEVLGS